MIIVNIIGGLGNQMFQYAFAYAASKTSNTIFKLDISGFESYGLRTYELELFNINQKIATNYEVKKLKYKPENTIERIVRRLRRKSLKNSTNFYREPYYHFDKTVFDMTGDIYFEGYWQSEKYFLRYREELLKQFTLKTKISSKSQVLSKDIQNMESVSLHIRRGDYVTNAQTNNIHGTCDLDYYSKAVALIKSKTEKPHFYIFSDDLDWANENLDFIDKLTFVELNNEAPDHEEMYLMSQCKHNIIANSSFSWWGAWLNQNQDKIVIAPKQWFKDVSVNTNDLIPKTWIRL